MTSEFDRYGIKQVIPEYTREFSPSEIGLIREDEDLVVSNEGFVFNIFSDLVFGLKDSLEFLKSVVTLNLNKYFDDKLNTGLRRSIYKLSHDLERLDKVTFADVRNIEIQVAPGLTDRIDKKLSYVEENIQDILKDTREYTDEFLGKLNDFLTDESVRMSGLFIKKKYETQFDKQKKIEKEIISQLSAKRESNTTIGRLIGNNTGLLTAITVSNNIFDMIDEKDLKKLLAEVASIKNRVAAVMELIENGMRPVSKPALEGLIAATSLVANQYTLLSKFYYIHFESTQILLKIADIYKKMD